MTRASPFQPAALALDAGDPVSALSLLRGSEAPEALAIRGIALAQLGEHEEARKHLEVAAKGLAKEGQPLLEAKAITALAELAVADRQLADATVQLEVVARRLDELGDPTNAAWARLVRLRSLAVLGDLDGAEQAWTELAVPILDKTAPVLHAVLHLTRAEIAARRFDPRRVQDALHLAASAANEADHAPLRHEVQAQQALLDEPIAVASDSRQSIELNALGVAELLGADAETLVLVDDIRRTLRVPGATPLSLAGRPAMQHMLSLLAAAWPEPVSAAKLIEELFEESDPDESHHVRLRVAVSRLRETLPKTLTLAAARGAWRLEGDEGWTVQLLRALNPAGSRALVILLSDGSSWSAGDLAVATRRSPRTVQRELAELVEEGRVRCLGEARARRYVLTRMSGRIASRLLLAGMADPR